MNRTIFLKITAIAAVIPLSANVLAQQQPAQPPQFQQQPQQQPDQQEQEVVAKVNGSAITKPELEATVQQQLRELQQAAQARGEQIAPQQVQQIQKESLDSLIESRLIEEYVTDQASVEDQEVKQAVERVKEQLSSQQIPFEQFLAMRGQTPESFEKRIEGSIAWQKFQEEELSVDKLKSYYEENKEMFQGDGFEQAQQQVAQTYTASLWEDIVKQMKPEADIEVVEGVEEKASPLQSQPPQQQPGGAPSGQPPR